jgi:ATP-dependent DNA helicase 2 subunit 2
MSYDHVNVCSQSIEFMPIDDTYNPHIHRTQQAIRRRATKPEAPVGPPPAVLMRFAMPPSELVADSRDRLDKLIAASDVKKGNHIKSPKAHSLTIAQVPPRTKGRRRDPIKPLSGIDIDALLNNSSAVLNRKDTISPSNAIPEFKQMIEKATSQEAIQSATDQMSKITQSLITDSTGTSNYQQAIANLKAIRRELIDYEFPEVYNAFAYQLKENLLDGKLGGDRREFMYEIKLAKLGLITSEVSELSEVKEEEASKVSTTPLELNVILIIV